MSDAPCPFCGSSDLGVFPSSHNVYRMRCINCAGWGPRGRSSREAHNLWNTRLSNTAASDVAEAEVARQAAQERDAREADEAYYSASMWREWGFPQLTLV